MPEQEHHHFSVTARHGIGFREFLVLTAAMMVCQAIAIDAMLPALPTIAHALGLSDENRSQWIITGYMAGLGCGQLLWGILADRYGRRPVLLTGLALYALAALLAGLSGSFTALLIWRFIHGVAAASVVVARSVIRDLYSGHRMARVMSLTFIVFLLSPVLAPSLGQFLLLVAPWRALFVMLAVFAVLVWGWVFARLPETLAPERRHPFSLRQLRHAFGLTLGHRAAVCYTLALAFVFGCLLAYLAMVQQVFGDVFHRPVLMPAMFALSALAMAAASFLNAHFVERFGMVALSQAGLLVLMAGAAVHVVYAMSGADHLATFVVLQSVTLACIGLTVGNFGAMAMEPMGAVAGIAASVQGFISAVGGALLGTLIGDEFHGSTTPLALGTLVCAVGSLLCVLLAERGRLFRPHRQAAELDVSAGIG